MLSIINHIDFSVLDTEEIIRNSVCVVNSSKSQGPGTVYDKRMGTLDRKPCITCESNVNCPGHFGHIELAVPVVNPLFSAFILKLIRNICFSCTRLRLSYEELMVKDKLNNNGLERFKEVSHLCSKKTKCIHCGLIQPTFITEDDKLYIYYKNKTNKSMLSVDEIYDIFHFITDDDMILMGLDPHKTHPRNMILHVLPVLPPVSRPYIISDGKQCNDDLTYKYQDIIKINEKLKLDSISEQKRQQLVNSLEFHISTMFNNSKEKAKQTNRRPIKCIKGRLTGKQGLIRKNIMGKRVNFSGRTVIGPDPVLHLGEIGVPESIAKTLTYPERVTTYNHDKMKQFLKEKKVNYIVKKDGRRIDLEFAKKIKLKIGDVVERQMMNGDYVVFNRQPTLHRPSMMAHKVRVLPGKTFRMNLSATTPYN